MELVSRLFFIVVVAGAAWGALEKENDVVVLTATNFDDFIKANSMALVEFYAPWCGHCQKLEPEYAKAATALKDSGVAFGKVDATAHGELASRYSVAGYPTIKFFKKGEPTDYTGGRTSETIIQWVENMTGPAVITMKEEEAKSPESGILFVARVKDKNKAYDIYEQVAEKNRMAAKFGVVISNSASDDLTVYRPHEEPVTTPIGSDADTLEKWIGTEKFPYLGPIDGDTYAAYEARALDLVWFAGSKDDYTKYGPHVREAAKKFRTDYSFVWLDTERFGGYTESELGLNSLPGLVLRNKESGRYKYPEGQKLVGKNIIKFFEDVKAGKIEKSLKSEPLPASNDEPVKVVVGKNFDDLVFRKDKDVLLEVYAPWCGHCKRLEPIYKELAEKLAHHKHIVVAKMDGTANESTHKEFAIQGFPTIFWIPAGSKTPISYTDDRTLKGFISFIKKHSSQPVNVDDRSADENTDDEKDEL